MKPTYTHFAPAWYVTKDDNDVVRDCTKTVKALLRNKVWERGFDYGYSGALKGISPDDVENVRVTITALQESHSGRGFMHILPGFVPNHAEANYRDFGMDYWRQNFVVTHVVLNRSFPHKNDSDFSMRYISAFHEAMAIVREVSALIKAAIQIVYHCDHMGLGNTEERRGAGVVFVESESGLYAEGNPSFIHTYPAIFEPASKDNFEEMYERLADQWHKPLWAINRFLKAIPGSFVDFEGILDLLFALEGLYDNNGSSHFIRLTSAILCSRRKSNAKTVDEVLRNAFRVRNEIVHGGKSYTGWEEVNMSTGKELYWRVFWSLKTVVAGMIQISLEKLTSNPNINHLRINNDDILDQVFSR